MSNVEAVRAKVQRILADKLGAIEVDRDGDFIVRFESVRTYITVNANSAGHTVVGFRCPLVRQVPITTDLYKWVAMEGQQFLLGSCCLMFENDQNFGWLTFDYAVPGDDLDESELMAALKAVIISGNHLDNEIQNRFGGKLFSET